MDDLISRQAAIEAIKEDKIDLTNPNVVTVFKATGDFEKVETQVMTCDRHIKILKQLPSAQPKIVRCVDCQKYIDYRCRDKHANLNDWRHEDDYCSFGKHREDDYETN